MIIASLTNMFAVLTACLLLTLSHARFHAEPLHSTLWNIQQTTVDSTTPLKFTIILKDNAVGISKLKQIALDVSDPTSPSYGKHLSIAEINALTAPPIKNINTITTWLKRNNIEDINVQNSGTTRINFQAKSNVAAKLFSTTFSNLIHPDYTDSITRAGSYEIPEDIESITQSFFGLHGFRTKSLKLTSGQKNVAVTPAVLNRVYNITGVTPKHSTNNTQAVAEFQGCTMDPKALAGFFTKFVKTSYKKGTDDTINKFEGDPSPTALPACGEAMLDVEYMMGVSSGIKSEFWYKQPFAFCDDIEKWSANILSATSPPLVHSMSYGECGNLTSTLSCDLSKRKAIDNNFMKIAARGISIIVSSGDEGTCWYPSDDQCGENFVQGGFTGKVLSTIQVDGQSGNGPPSCCTLASDAPNPISAGWSFTPGTHVGKGGVKNGTCTIYKTITGKTKNKKTQSSRTVTRKTKLWTSWPAESEWVTAVGATRFVEQKIGNEQMATDSFGSGGGFSWYAKTPKWQIDAVASFFSKQNKNDLPPSQSFQRDGRAIPDVAVLGAGYQVLQAGVVSSASGTSASAPVFAGMVSLLNEARIQAGKPPMGFLNPFIYQNQDAFTDIVKGSNPNSHNDVPIYGFNATIGYDPLTGVGTPKFDALLVAAMKN